MKKPIILLNLVFSLGIYACDRGRSSNVDAPSVSNSGQRMMDANGGDSQNSSSTNNDSHGSQNGISNAKVLPEDWFIGNWSVKGEGSYDGQHGCSFEKNNIYPETACNSGRTYAIFKSNNKEPQKIWVEVATDSTDVQLWTTYQFEMIRDGKDFYVICNDVKEPVGSLWNDDFIITTSTSRCYPAMSFSLEKTGAFRHSRDVRHVRGVFEKSAITYSDRKSTSNVSAVPDVSTLQPAKNIDDVRYNLCRGGGINFLFDRRNPGPLGPNFWAVWKDQNKEMISTPASVVTYHWEGHNIEVYAWPKGWQNPNSPALQLHFVADYANGKSTLKLSEQDPIEMSCSFFKD